MSASSNLSADYYVRNYFLQNYKQIKATGALLSEVPILPGTEELDYFRGIGEGDVGELLGTSILEVLWLNGGHTQVCKNGVVMTLKKGTSDLTTNGGHLEVLIEEMREAGVGVAGFSLPKGRFFVEGVNLSKTKKLQRRVRSWKTIPIRHAHECDTDMGRTKIERKTPRRNRNSMVTPPRAEEQQRIRISRVSLSSEEPDTLPVYHSHEVSSDIASQHESETNLFEPDLEALDEGGGGPSSWGAIVEEMQGSPPTKPPRDVDLMFSTREEKEVALECGLTLQDDVDSAGEKLLRMRYKKKLSPDMWNRYGQSILRVAGYGSDAPAMMQLLTQFNAVNSFWFHEDEQKFVGSLKAKGVRLNEYEPREGKMRGILEQAGQSTLSRSLNRSFSGNVTEVARHDWKKIVLSEPMRAMMEGLGISGGMTGFGGDLLMRMVDFLSVNPGVKLNDVSNLVPWVEGTTVNFLSPSGVHNVPVKWDFDLLDYRSRASSMTSRDYSPEDSKYLYLATTSSKWIVHKDQVQKLFDVFDVPGPLEEQLVRRNLLKNYTGRVQKRNSIIARPPDSD
jgi:hypothetical protein